MGRSDVSPAMGPIREAIRLQPPIDLPVPPGWSFYLFANYLKTIWDLSSMQATMGHKGDYWSTYLTTDAQWTNVNRHHGYRLENETRIIEVISACFHSAQNLNFQINRENWPWSIVDRKAIDCLVFRDGRQELAVLMASLGPPKSLRRAASLKTIHLLLPREFKLKVNSRASPKCTKRLRAQPTLCLGWGM